MSARTGQDLQVAPDRNDHVRGAADARVTIIEYGDFECPVCRAAEPGIRMLLDQHPREVRLIYRHNPLESAHPHALMAAEAAEAAGAQGQFWPMHDLLMHDAAPLHQAALREYAGKLGLDLADFSASLADEIYRQRVREHMNGAALSHVRSSPGIFVNGRLCDVSGGLHALGEAIARELR